MRLLQLRQDTRLRPQAPAVEYIDPQMVILLARLLKIPGQSLSMEQFWLGVARLGGYLGRKHGGPSGWRTLWRGWRYLADQSFGAHLAQDTS